MAERSIMLGKLLASIASVEQDCLVTGLTLDSRQVNKGHVFIAVAGEQVDGRNYIPQAVRQSASVIIAERRGFAGVVAGVDSAVSIILIENLAQQVSELAARFYGHPSRACRVIGVTGTNAKTSVCYLLAQTAAKLGVPAAMIGTIGYGESSLLKSSPLTTPDAISVQRQLRELVDEGFKMVCMEVSSHGLVQHRVAAVDYEVAVFTNLSQDHLDYHHTMQAYGEAKQMLFEFNSLTSAVINADDQFGRELMSRVAINTTSYGETGSMAVSDVQPSVNGVKFSLTYNGQVHEIKTPLVGDFNVMNLTAVVGALLELGFAINDVAIALSDCQAPPGRLERIGQDKTKPTVVVDYAHTPDALEKALGALRTHCDGVLSVVFGCGGDRDKAKRPVMGSIAERFADEVILTDDNPRSEVPSHIVAGILTGMQHAPTVRHDRSSAINMAVLQSKPQDWVLVAGKGHENQQVYADHTLEINDRQIALDALNAWQGLAA